ncbi:hypothetical protein QNH10_15205 [Sporosarcina thermotolerans]|uniref:hypothetical protein n=1 Tax=Sporosarcina thermotolerans TaxID=633404 RepID=UPI0024BD03BB|nr:hypothetical protein [Sporosarcina thermotolerans]WHT47504.1 hypothetical protein QNH10_15205 [Sporosarcina thermotolerans]
MKFHQLLLAGFHEPKKLAAFRLLPIGRVIRFAFFFILLMTLISFSLFVLGMLHFLKLVQNWTIIVKQLADYFILWHLLFNLSLPHFMYLLELVSLQLSECSLES